MRAVVRRKDEIDQSTVPSIGRLRSNNHRLPRRPDRHLGRGQKTGPHDDAAGSQTERRSQSAAIGDSAGCNDGSVTGDFDDLRDEHQRAHESAVSTCLAPLGDDDVRSAVNRTPGLLDVHHLLHPQAASLMSLIDKITGIAHVV